MSGKICTALDDPRPVLCLSNEVHGYNIARVGQDGVTRIAPYEELGQAAWVTYFAVYKGDEIVSRVPGWFPVVHYFSAEELSKGAQHGD